MSNGTHVIQQEQKVAHRYPPYVWFSLIWQSAMERRFKDRLLDVLYGSKLMSKLMVWKNSEPRKFFNDVQV